MQIAALPSTALRCGVEAAGPCSSFHVPSSCSRSSTAFSAAPCVRSTRPAQLRVVARAATTSPSSERAASWNPSISGSTASIDAPASPSQKTYSSFDNMLSQSELPVLVDFHTHWCGPCQMMGHVLSTVSKRLSGAVSCVRIDIDKYPALASKYQVQALPTLVLFKDGKPIDKVEGYVALQPLLDRVNYFLGRPMGPGRSFRP